MNATSFMRSSPRHLPDNFDIKFDRIRYMLVDNCIGPFVRMKDAAHSFKGLIEILTQGIQIKTGAHEEAQMSPRCDAVYMDCKQNQYPSNNVAVQGVWIPRRAVLNK